MRLYSLFPKKMTCLYSSEHVHVQIGTMNVFGCSDVFQAFYIRGSDGPGLEKMWPQPYCAARLAVNNVLARPIPLVSNFAAHVVWSDVCSTQMQSWMLDYVLLALYCHLFEW